MKRLLVFFTIIIMLGFLGGCDSPDPDESIVKLDGPIQETQSGIRTLEFNGSLVNTADIPVKSIYVLIILNDADGNIIQTKSVLLDENVDDIMEPKEVSFFTIVFEDIDPEAVYSKEVEIYYDPAN
ncbi:MAG: hypothetical protein ACRENO_02020 [Thermodesulfobacteriota bacterium]